MTHVAVQHAFNTLGAEPTVSVRRPKNWEKSIYGLHENFGASDRAVLDELEVAGLGALQGAPELS